jgi:hypothetical protein
MVIETQARFKHQRMGEKRCVREKGRRALGRGSRDDDG